MAAYNLDRFREPHRQDYPAALSEIRGGRKQTHWMWYIFPQMAGLGHSRTSVYYGIRDLEEARAFLADAYLGGCLREISGALLELDTHDAEAVFGRPDCWKLRSSMTLFSRAAGDGGDGGAVFRAVLAKFYGGQEDERTLRLLGLMKTPSD